MSKQRRKRAANQMNVDDSGWLAPAQSSSGHASAVATKPGGPARNSCPRCGGKLSPVTGWQRLLDPKLVCTDCRYLWANPADPPRHAKRRPASELTDEEFFVRQRNWMLVTIVLTGLFVIPWMVSQWSSFASGFCSGCGIRQVSDWSEIASEKERLARLLIPTYSVFWTATVVAFTRARQTTMQLTVSFGVWVCAAIAAFVIL